MQTTFDQMGHSVYRRGTIIDLEQYRAAMEPVQAATAPQTPVRRRRRRHHAGVRLGDLLSLGAVGMTLAVTGVILAGL